MKLAGEDALALATAWGTKLDGRVSLQASSHSGWLHLHDEQWVVIELQRLSRARSSGRLVSNAVSKEQLLNVREALDIWHAIACCPGYTGAENPIFWRTVISRAYHGSDQRHRCCSDARSFFAQLPDGSEFPRFRLCFNGRLCSVLAHGEAPMEAQYVETVWREFFCLDGQDCDHTDEFNQAMDQLRPFICQARYARRVAVGVDLPSFDRRALYPAVRRLLAETASPNQPRASRFKVEELSFDGSRLLSHLNKLEILDVWMQLPDVKLVGYGWTHIPITGSALLAGVIRVATALDELYTAKLQALVVSRQSLTDQHFAGLCIAVARSTSLRHVWFRMVESQHDWAWLALAIFHPTHKQESWRELTIETATITANDLDVMRAVRDQGAMALLPFITDEGHSGGEGTTCKVTISPGVLRVEVRGSENLDADGSSGMTVAAISIPSQPDTLCAFVPGHGALWIPRHHVTELDHDQPKKSTGESSLSTFQCGRLDGDAATVRDFVCLLGSSLTLVNIADNSRVPRDDVEAMLRSCPKLASLNMVLDPIVFTPPSLCGEVVPGPWSSLVSLSVVELSRQQARDVMDAVALGTRGPLPALRSLHIAIAVALGTRGSPLTDSERRRLQHFEAANTDGVYASAARLLRLQNLSLRHVRLQGLIEPQLGMLSYDIYRRRMLTTLSIDEQVLDRSNRAKYAFLSALRDRETSAALSRLTPDTLRLIFAFAGRESANVWLAL